MQEASDVAILTEYRTMPCAVLFDAFHQHAAFRQATIPPKNQNGVCALSRLELGRFRSRPVPMSRHRWLPCHVPDLDLEILGVHVPNQTEIWNKREFWDCLEAYGMSRKRRRSLIVGDLNSALDEDCEGDVGPPCLGLQRLLDAGWVDAWRAANGDAKEYSWYSHRKNGFRLDYCLISPPMAHSVKSARLRHDVRTSGLSDHSLLSVELDP